MSVDILLEQILSEAAIPRVSGQDGPWVLVARTNADGRSIYLWADKALLPDEAAVQQLFRLTPTQARVARMLASRRTNGEIASLLGVTIHTARRHVEAVLLRMGVRNRWEIEECVYKAAVSLPSSAMPRLSVAFSVTAGEPPSTDEEGDGGQCAVCGATCTTCAAAR